jgi:hypothetical protein
MKCHVLSYLSHANIIYGDCFFLSFLRLMEDQVPSCITGVEWKSSFSGRFTPRERTQIPIEVAAGWVSEPVRTLWGTKKSLVRVGNRTFPCSLVTVPTELSLCVFKRHLQALSCAQLTAALLIHYSAQTSRLWTTEEVLLTSRWVPKYDNTC